VTFPLNYEVVLLLEAEGRRKLRKKGTKNHFNNNKNSQTTANISPWQVITYFRSMSTYQGHSMLVFDSVLSKRNVNMEETKHNLERKYYWPSTLILVSENFYRSVRWKFICYHYAPVLPCALCFFSLLIKKNRNGY